MQTELISVSKIWEIEAQRAFGFTERLFTRARNRLAVLYSCLDAGTDPPRQRKFYRSRTPL